MDQKTVKNCVSCKFYGSPAASYAHASHTCANCLSSAARVHWKAMEQAPHPYDPQVASPPQPASKRQEGGSHYTDMAIQPMEYSMANNLDPMQHTAIKYISRFRSKAGIADLRKAIHTIEMLIEWEEKHATTEQ